MFFLCKTEDEIKKLFRKLAIYLHPDKGGDVYLMNLLIEAREHASKCISRENIRDVEESQAFKNACEDIYLSDSRLDIIDHILEYAKLHKSFNNKFTISVKDFLLQKGYITSMQYNSLVKIYYSFRMDEK